MEAKRLTAQCPICRRPVPRGVREHLYDHSKSDLVRGMLGCMQDDGDEE